MKKARVEHEEYLPMTTTDFTAGAQRIVQALKDKPGRKIVYVYWAGVGNPLKIVDMDLKRYGIEISTVSTTLQGMAPYKQLIGMEGSTFYYFDIPKNKVNEWLVANHNSRFKAPPDFFTLDGFNAALAVVEALKRTKGDTNTEKLIAAMEDMSFDSPKGKITLRKEEHQAMHSMYHTRIKDDPALPWGVPELIREIKPEEMNIPVRNKR
jgi:branched-chain amino acid transport system substrate-binding protein